MTAGWDRVHSPAAHIPAAVVVVVAYMGDGGGGGFLWVSTHMGARTYVHSAWFMKGLVLGLGWVEGWGSKSMGSLASRRRSYGGGGWSVAGYLVERISLSLFLSSFHSLSSGGGLVFMVSAGGMRHRGRHAHKSIPCL